MLSKNKIALSMAALLSVSLTASFAKDETTGGKMSTASTQDIINTLRSRGSFHRMLDGLDTAYDLDNVLKGKGPFTVFAAEDKAWGKLNQADQDTLFANKKKLNQVLSYEVIKGEKLDAKALGMQSKVKSMEGHEIRFSTKKDDADKGKEVLYADKAKVKTADIYCTNGIIHIVDAPIMPPLSE
jgi:uncharacterized surface protein with fasciclin (FAS1) repeats